MHVPKINRKSKVSPRAVKAVYGSRCEDQPRYHRVIPYHENGVEVEVFPTIITNQFTCISMQDEEDVFPWKREAKPYQPPIDTADKKETA